MPHTSSSLAFGSPSRCLTAVCRPPFRLAGVAVSSGFDTCCLAPRRSGSVRLWATAGQRTVLRMDSRNREARVQANRRWVPRKPLRPTARAGSSAGRLTVAFLPKPIPVACRYWSITGLCILAIHALIAVTGRSIIGTCGVSGSPVCSVAHWWYALPTGTVATRLVRQAVHGGTAEGCGNGQVRSHGRQHDRRPALWAGRTLEADRIHVTLCRDSAADVDAAGNRARRYRLRIAGRLRPPCLGRCPRGSGVQRRYQHAGPGVERQPPAPAAATGGCTGPKGRVYHEYPVGGRWSSTGRAVRHGRPPCGREPAGGAAAEEPRTVATDADVRRVDDHFGLRATRSQCANRSSSSHKGSTISRCASPPTTINQDQTSWFGSCPR